MCVCAHMETNQDIYNWQVTFHYLFKCWLAFYLESFLFAKMYTLVLKNMKNLKIICIEKPYWFVRTKKPTNEPTNQHAWSCGYIFSASVNWTLKWSQRYLTFSDRVLLSWISTAQHMLLSCCLNSQTPKKHMFILPETLGVLVNLGDLDDLAILDNLCLLVAQ